MILRPYQQKAFDAALFELRNGARSTLVVLPTGGGKTIVFAHLAKAFSEHGRVLVLAHREELIRQAAKKIKLVTGDNPEIEMASEWANHDDSHAWSSRFVVASIQSLISGQERKRYERFDPNSFSFLVIDEAHHATAASYVEVINYFQNNPELRVMGVTATGDRGDGEGLGGVFESIAYAYELPDAIRDGWLCPVRQRSVSVAGLDFSKCRTTAGDLNQGDLAAAMEFEAALHPVAHATIEVAAGLEKGSLEGIKDSEDRQTQIGAMMAGKSLRKTLVFTVSVKQAERTAEIFNRWIPQCARFICGETPKKTRQDILAEYSAGIFSILVNVSVATEGFDEPGIELVVMARPTKSRALFAQMSGRSTRPLESIAGILGTLESPDARRKMIVDSKKPYAEILDFVGNAGRHKLITMADILGGSEKTEEMIARANELAQENSIDVEEALDQAEKEIEGEQEAYRIAAAAEQESMEAELEREAETARRARLVATTNYHVSDVDAFDRHATGPERKTNTVRGGATDKQIAFLVKLGVSQETAVGYGKKQAGAVITSLKEKRCTSSQANFLRRLGYVESDISGMNFNAASVAIDESLRAQKGVAS